MRVALCAIGSVVVAELAFGAAEVRSAGYCPELDWSPAFGQDFDPMFFPCDTWSDVNEQLDIPSGCAAYWLKVTTTACEGEAPANGEVIGTDAEFEDHLLGYLVNGVWSSTCSTAFDEFINIHVEDLDAEISAMRVDWYCCELCCGPQNASGTPTATGLWYWQCGECVRIANCSGVDCDEGFTSVEACEYAYQWCTSEC